MGKAKAKTPMRFNPGFVRQAVANAGSQAEIARFLGVSKQAVKFWCDGEIAPSDEHVRALAEEYGLSPEGAWCEAEVPTGPLAELLAKMLQFRHVSLRRMTEGTGVPLGTLSEIKNGKRQAKADQDEAIRRFCVETCPEITGQGVTSSWAARERGRRQCGRRVAMNLSEDVVRFFKLQDDPWRGDVRADRDVFLTRDYQRMHKHVTRAVDRRDFAVIAGPTGSGKTYMALKIIREIGKARKKVKLAPILSPDIKQVSASTICDAIVKNLAPGTRPQVRTEKLAIQVCSILAEHNTAGNTPVLLIDDAHLCTPTTLRQLKRFYELRDVTALNPYDPLLAIVLLGWPELSVTLNNNAALLEVARRADVVQLRGLRGEYDTYVKQKLARVGLRNGRAIFEPAAIKALARIPQAQFPLPANRILSRAMYLCWEETQQKARPVKKRGVVTADDIKHAAEGVL